MEQEEKKEEQQQGSHAKTRKKLEKVMGQLVAVLGNPYWSKKLKIGNDSLSDFLTRATESRKEKLYKDFEAKLNSLVDDKAAYDKVVKQKEKEFLDAVEGEQKKFIGRAEELLAMIEDVGGVEKRYLETLTSVVSPLGTQETTSTEETKE